MHQAGRVDPGPGRKDLSPTLLTGLSTTLFILPIRSSANDLGGTRTGRRPELYVSLEVFLAISTGLDDRGWQQDQIEDPPVQSSGSTTNLSVKMIRKILEKTRAGCRKDVHGEAISMYYDECVECYTPVREAVDDVRLIINIVQSYQRRSPVAYAT